MAKSVAEVRAELTAPGSLFELDEVDVGGVVLRVWKSAPQTLRDVLALSSLHGDKTLIVYEDERYSFAEHHRLASAFGLRLVERFGVCKGDRVAIAMRNFPEWMVAFWGAAAVGAIVVPLNAWWTGPELEYGVTDSGAKILVADEERAERLRPYADLGLDVVIVCRNERPLRDPKEHAWDEVLGDVSGVTGPPDVELVGDDDATIFYTSGTTGFPKGALGTHRNICQNVMSLAYGFLFSSQRKSGSGAIDAAAMAEQASDMATMLSVPLFHVTGCHAMMLSAVAFGTKLVMMYKWDPERALELIARERITTIGGVPAMVWQLLEAPGFATADISSVKAIAYGGAPAPAELVRRIEQLFPGRIPTNSWGMTETSATCSTNSGVDYLERPDSCGPVLPICDAKVVDAAGNDLPAGPDVTGELWVRGPNVVKGYWHKPEATAETFTADGWLKTGDIARIDDEGFIYITDRAKDMIIRGGENVYCAEIEGVLFEHPAVTDCAVFGTPHDVLGEEVAAVVRLKPGATAVAAELQAHCAQRLAKFKVPVKIWFWTDELPRNPAGKILKRTLRDQALTQS
ncbi:MAG: class I adenylate-forming enzyme family protein [Acidimicrobiales bacterium]